MMRKRYYAARFACWELHPVFGHPSQQQRGRPPPGGVPSPGPAPWQRVRGEVRPPGETHPGHQPAGPGLATPGPGKGGELNVCLREAFAVSHRASRTPTPAWRKSCISQYGGPHGEIGASLRYLSQRYAMPIPELKAILTDIGTEELSHLEMVGTIVYQLTRNMTPGANQGRGL